MSPNSFLSGNNKNARHILRGRWSNLKLSVAVSLGISFCCLVVYCSLCSSPFSTTKLLLSPEEDPELVRVLRSTALATAGRRSKSTVILTMINKAWVERGSILDVFLEGFSVGDGTQELVKHLVIVSLDQRAYERCQEIHPHCYALTTPGVNFTGDATFMTQEYLLVVWRRIDFLGSVLRLGYNFVSTDADILWFRNPFPRFHEDADFQVSCDMHLGDDSNRDNLPNTGFTFVRSNPRTVRFYKHWYRSKDRFPGEHDQDVFNRIKFDDDDAIVGLKMRFLDTAYFGGFCEPVKDLNVACTMHANCCVGLDTKVHDLRNLLRDWKRFSALPPESRNGVSFDWTGYSPPFRCRA
ncbi:unnamed protein product [Linum trigynum]|uniref:Nucleotide-diphospho-sugar transferase domain-containing protein n=1 Tax=Linum trigynum TaxID=586398 RepID=A0AAV2CLV6_9ROSI